MKAQAPKPAAPRSDFYTAAPIGGSTRDLERQQRNAALYHDIMGRDDE